MALKRRNRWVKPEFHSDYDLWKLDKDSGLPCRLTYIALWSIADREGRMEWKPEEVKLAVMPWDDMETFQATVAALVKAEKLVLYALRRSSFAVIPLLRLHQVFNVNESPSVLPPPPKDLSKNLKRAFTRASRVVDASVTRDSHPDKDIDKKRQDSSNYHQRGRGRTRTRGPAVPEPSYKNEGGETGTHEPALVAFSPELRERARAVMERRESGTYSNGKGILREHIDTQDIANGIMEDEGRGRLQANN